jgi:guanyl-specific ribonuclease Sa
MAKTVGFGKLAREMLSNERLPPDVRVAIIEFKNSLKVGVNIKTRAKLKPHHNREGLLPTLAHGQKYFEFDVGRAHPDDEEERGVRRLVGLVDSQMNLLKIYFSDSHYTGGVWQQLQYP